jgi:hypothetical protein
LRYGLFLAELSAVELNELVPFDGESTFLEHFICKGLQEGAYRILLRVTFEHCGDKSFIILIFCISI